MPGQQAPSYARAVSVELPLHQPAAVAASTVRDAAWFRRARLARRLAWASLAWLCIEGSIGVLSGLLAGSVALVGFGLDSAIEGLASVIVVWRFTGSRTLSEASERTAQKCVAVSFYLLAPYIAIESLRALLGEHHAETSIVGIALTTGSLAICPWLGIAKRRLGEKLGSAASNAKAPRTCCAAAVRLPGRCHADRPRGQHHRRHLLA